MGSFEGLATSLSTTSVIQWGQSRWRRGSMDKVRSCSLMYSSVPNQPCSCALSLVRYLSPKNFSCSTPSLFYSMPFLCLTPVMLSLCS